MSARALPLAFVPAMLLLILPLSAGAQTPSVGSQGMPDAPEIVRPVHDDPGVAVNQTDGQRHQEAGRHPRPRPKPGYGEWVAAQLLIALAGMLAALLAFAFAPRAANLSLSAIESEPVRCLVVGIIGMGALSAINAINSALAATIIWIPAAVVVGLTSTAVVLFSGIVGSAYVGSVVARRICGCRPGFFGKATAGLLTLAFMNCLPIIAPASLLLQMGMFIPGLGALIICGFGRGPDWLSQRLAAARKEWDHDR